MSWSILDFVALCLAATAVADAWFEGSLFAGWRQFLQSKADFYQPAATEADAVANDAAGAQLPAAMRLADRFLPFWAVELLTCRFCLSYHIPWLLAVCCLCPLPLDGPDWLLCLRKLPLYSLAVTGASHLIARLVPDPSNASSNDTTDATNQ